MSLSYIGQGLGDVPTNELASIHDAPMHKVLLKDIAVRIFGADVHRSQILCAINASIVALGSIPNDMVSISCIDFLLIGNIDDIDGLLFLWLGSVC